MAAGPPSRYELISLMTAATNPQAIPVAMPRPGARRGGGPEEDADAHRHRERGAPLAPVCPVAFPHSPAQRQVAEDEQQFHREDRLDQGERGERQGAYMGSAPHE